MPMKLIEIHLKIDEEVIKEIETSLMVKAGCGSLYGTVDEFCAKLIQAMRKGWDRVTIKNIPVKKRKKRKIGGK